MKKYKIIIFILIVFFSATVLASALVAEASAQTIDNDVDIIDAETDVDQQVMRDISSQVRLVDTKNEDGRTVLTVDADVDSDIEIIYPIGNDQMGRYTVSVEAGTSDIVMDTEYDEVAIWHGQTGIMVDITGPSILSEMLSGATTDHLQYAAAGGGFGALFAVVLYFRSAKRKLTRGFSEVIWGSERVEVSDSKNTGLYNKIKDMSNVRLAMIITPIIGVIWFYSISFADIPVWAYVFIYAFAGLTILSYFVVPQIADYLDILQPDESIILELDAAMSDDNNQVNKKVPAKAWVSHPELTEKVDIEGERRQIHHMGKTMHVVNRVDFDKMKAVASDIMSVPDEHLIGHLRAIEEHKARSNRIKLAFQELMNNLKNITDTVEMRHHLQLNAKERDLSTYGGDIVSDVLEQDIEAYEMLASGASITDEYDDILNDSKDGISESSSSSASNADSDSSSE